MTRKPEEIRNFEASVRQRLFNLSKGQGRDFQSVLKLYFLERSLSAQHLALSRELPAQRRAALLRPCPTGGAPVHQADQRHRP